jgi:hypothetical protein
MEHIFEYALFVNLLQHIYTLTWFNLIFVTQLPQQDVNKLFEKKKKKKKKKSINHFQKACIAHAQKSLRLRARASSEASEAQSQSERATGADHTLTPPTTRVPRPACDLQAGRCSMRVIFREDNVFFACGPPKSPPFGLAPTPESLFLADFDRFHRFCRLIGVLV